MLNLIRHAVPSMFHRRLLLLALFALGGLVMLGLQIYRLSVVQGAEHRRQAERALVQRRLIPTIRGRITDRHGRVLAQDRPAYDLAVDYSVLIDRWSYLRARRRAYKASPQRWSELDFDNRERLIREHQQPYDEQVEQLWNTLCDLGSIERAELDERRHTVVRRVQTIASDVWVRQLESLRTLRGDEDLDLELADVANPISEEQASHPLLFNVDDRVLAAVERLIAQAKQRQQELRQPGVTGANEYEVWLRVSVQRSRQREYPLETLSPVVDRSTLPGPLRSDKSVEMQVRGVATHLIGLMRDIWEEDVVRRPFRRNVTPAFPDGIDLSGYLPGDRCGAWGMERAMEDFLRGHRGQSEELLDTGEHLRDEPQPGGDLALSVDVMLQARIAAIMDPRLGLTEVREWNYHDDSSDPAVPQKGQSLNGSVVVLDVPTGQVLAAVSAPALSFAELRDNPTSVWGDRLNQPFVNRPLMMPYQPGSTVKPLVLAAALTDRKLGASEAINCNGHLEPDRPDRYRCWIFKQSLGARHHGPLEGPEALARSCNIFFYTLGRRLGGPRITDWYAQFGLGHPTGCGLDEEVGGDLPVNGGAKLNTADATFMGIGQGPVQWTPMQAAASYAALARGGYWKSPTLFRDPEQLGKPQEDRDLQLDPRGVDEALEGLFQAINAPYGTGHHIRISSTQNEPTFNITGVKLMGKSGTADAVPLRLVPDEEFRRTGRTRITSNDPIVRKGDHAWMIVMVQRPGEARPRYVVAVVVEYGGSGGAVAGPVANQVLHAMRAEGYL